MFEWRLSDAVCFYCLPLWTIFGRVCVLEGDTQSSAGMRRLLSERPEWGKILHANTWGDWGGEFTWTLLIFCFELRLNYAATLYCIQNQFSTTLPQMPVWEICLLSNSESSCSDLVIEEQIKGQGFFQSLNIPTSYHLVSDIICITIAHLITICNIIIQSSTSAKHNFEKSFCYFSISLLSFAGSISM